MKIQSSSDVPSYGVTMPGAQGCQVRWLIDRSDGAPTFAMRQFEVDPGGNTPCHHHPYEHEVYVLAGEGVVLAGDREQRLQAGDFVFVEPNELHQFRNTGAVPMRFLCLVPNSAGAGPNEPPPECGSAGAAPSL